MDCFVPEFSPPLLLPIGKNNKKKKFETTNNQMDSSVRSQKSSKKLKSCCHGLSLRMERASNQFIERAVKWVGPVLVGAALLGVCWCLYVHFVAVLSYHLGEQELFTSLPGLIHLLICTFLFQGGAYNYFQVTPSPQRHCLQSQSRRLMAMFCPQCIFTSPGAPEPLASILPQFPLFLLLSNTALIMR